MCFYHIDSTPSFNSKPIRRYTKRLITALNDLSSNPPPTDSSSSSPMWLVHFYNYLNSHIIRFDLTNLTKLIPKSITSKSIIYFHQIHLFVEQLLYRFIYYHHCTCQIYLSLSNTFLTLLRDGFQMPPEESENDKNSEEQKNEGGPSGMGDGQIEKDAKDVSDQIESEDQLEETKMPGQEQENKNEKTEEEQQQHVDEEENGIEVSFDFEAPMEDPSQNDNQDDDDDEDNEKDSETNDENIDDQMGDVNEEDQGEIFDENKWGDEDKEEEEEKEEDEEKKKPNETDKSTGKDKKQRDGLSAKDDQLDLLEEPLEENPETTNENNIEEDQPPDTTNNELNNEEQQPYELPENMDLDGNDEKEQTNEDNQDNPEDENIDLPNEENPDNDQQSETEENQDENDPINSSKNQIPDNLPDEQEQLEQSALTQDKTSTNNDSKNQPNDLDKNFSNAQTFEEEKSKNQKENLGESSTLNTSQTQQISSNQQNQLTQQLDNENPQEDNINNSTNQSNEQRTLSEIASFIDQNIKAAFDIEQTDENMNIDDNEQPSLEQDNQQQTQIYAHAKNIPKDFSQQKQILDSATDQQTKNLNEQEDQQTEPMIIDNQEQQQQQQEEKKTEKQNSASKLQKEPINKSKSSSTLNPEQATETMENLSLDKPFISTTTVEHQFDYLTNVKSNLTEQIEYQLEEWYTNINEHVNEINDAEQLWTHLEYLTQPYVYELCEQLRLLLEPTQKTKYSGDYRTGKRLNMKRIISYIASDFRKDRIWLRRSKPSKRQYQLILAIDDSQSMDNLQVKRLALESLILLGQTLNLLDIGQFGIVSFGQYIQMLQPLNQNFNHENGIQVLKQLKFDQTKTLLAEVKFSFRKKKKIIYLFFV